LYGERVCTCVIDAQSSEGLWKSVRHWVGEYPGFIVNRRARVTGWNGQAPERLLVSAAEGSVPA